MLSAPVSAMAVYKRDTRWIVNRFRGHRVGFADCIASLDAALARFTPELRPEELPALRGLLFANNENRDEGNGAAWTTVVSLATFARGLAAVLCCMGGISRFGSLCLCPRFVHHAQLNQEIRVWRPSVGAQAFDGFGPFSHIAVVFHKQTTFVRTVLKIPSRHVLSGGRRGHGMRR
jgi:hypothetical protein